MLLGAIVILKFLVKKIALKVIYPVVKLLYKVFFRRKNEFLCFKPKNIENWVLINGSCTSIG